MVVLKMLGGLLLALLAGGGAAAAERVTLRGRVVDAQTGEAIARAQVTVPGLGLEATSDAAGRFALAGVPEGEVELVVTTVGYGLVRRAVQAFPDVPDIEVRVGQEALKRAEEVVVEAPPFDPPDPAAPATHVLRGVELRNLGGVITDDPLRSVHSLPGVATGDDFYASFATRGAGFSSVGFYIDGVLMSAPFHTIRDANDSYSLTILNGDVVESLALLSGGAPARYGDRTGAALDVHLREGSREELSGRASLGASGVSATLEGPLGRGRKSSWLVSARKSYLDYILERIDIESGTVLGYHDLTARLAHHPTPAQTVSATLLHGRSKWREGDEADPVTVESARAGSDLGILQWRHDAARGPLSLSAFVARETGRNLEGPAETFTSTSGHWGLRADLLRAVGSHRLEGGVLVRRLGEDTIARDFDGRSRTAVVEDFEADGTQWGLYAQDTWTGFGGRLSLTGGARYDRFEETGEGRLLPRASTALALTTRTKAFAAYGDYAQFPRFSDLYGRQGNALLEAERSRHLAFGIEQRLGERTRARVEAYEQREEGLLFAPGAQWRLEGGRVLPPRAGATLRNALTGRSRGLEVLLQRRSANGVSGWVAYSYAHATRREAGSSARFDSDFDQRHTLTAHLSARVSGTWNLSAKYRYGSSFPISGYFRGDLRGLASLAAERNLLRPPAYSRLDLRANKDWVFRAWKLTLFAEVLNVLGRENARYSLDFLDGRTGRVAFDREALFPLLPGVGVTVDF